MMRALRIALFAAALCARAEAQNAPPAGREQALHREALRTERTALFFEAWAEAEPAARASAAMLLAAEASEGAPLGARPSLSALAAARRVLRGEDPKTAANDALSAFADALDLQAVPGAFPAASEGRGTPIQVTVYRTIDGPAAVDVEVSLYWIAPDGSRVRARTEPFAAGAFRGRGFVMYVRAPLSEPGTWHLLPVLRAAGREVEGTPVPVACVRDLEDRLAALEGVADAQPVRERLRALSDKGLRSAEVAGAEPLLAMLAGDARTAWIPLAAATAGGGRSEASPARLFGDFPDGRRGGAVVVLWSAGDREELPFAGPVGAAWRALAEERGLGLFVLRAAAGESEILREGLAEVERRTGKPPILVARGTSTFTATLLLVAAGMDRVPLSGLVLASPSASPPRTLPASPVLLVVPADGHESDGEALPSNVRVMPGARDALLVEPRLPALVGAWLDEL